VPEHRGDACAVQLGRQPERLLDLLGGDEGARGDLLREQPRAGERLPVVQPAGGQGAEDLAAGVEDVAVRVAEGAVLDSGLRARYESSFFRMPRNPRNRFQ
jgi:hypothetical protein